MRRALLCVVVIIAALASVDPVGVRVLEDTAGASVAAAEALPAGSIDACVSYSRTTGTCFRSEPLRLQFGQKFFFRGRLGSGLDGPVSVWRMRPNGTHWAPVGSATLTADRRFTWQWRPTEAQVADGYYRFQFRAGLARSKNLRVKVLRTLCDGDVCLQGYVYVPDELTISAGDTVTWTSISSLSHTVDADDESFESPLINYGESFQHTFATTGVFTYHCDLHPLQLGTITVE